MVLPEAEPTIDMSITVYPYGKPPPNRFELLVSQAAGLPAAIGKTLQEKAAIYFPEPTAIESKMKTIDSLVEQLRYHTRYASGACEQMIDTSRKLLEAISKP